MDLGDSLDLAVGGIIARRAATWVPWREECQRWRDEAGAGNFDALMARAEQAEAALADLRARVEALADKWIASDDLTQWGDHSRNYCGQDLRALLGGDRDV